MSTLVDRFLKAKDTQQEFRLVPYPFRINEKQIDGGKYVALAGQITITNKQKYTFAHIDRVYKKLIAPSIKKLFHADIKKLEKEAKRNKDKVTNTIDRIYYDIDNPDYSQFLVFPDYRRSVNPTIIIPNILGEDRTPVFTAFFTKFHFIDRWYWENQEFYVVFKGKTNGVPISSLN